MIRTALQIPNFTYPDVTNVDLFERVASVATTAEASGFDAVMVMDHFYQLPLLGPPEGEMFEGYTLLSALAARTERVLLGTLVTGVTYRNPAILAKIVTTLDVISRGRAMLGIGAAWFDFEHTGLGVDFPPTGVRMEMLEEAVQICRAMFREEKPTFTGKHFRTHEALNSPPPVRAGGPPIMIGGQGEKKTIPLAAKYADMWNCTAGVPELPHKLEVLAAACEAQGRDIATINKTPLIMLVLGETTEAAEQKRDRALAQRNIDWASLPEEMQQQLSGRMFVGDADAIGERVHDVLGLGMDGIVVNMPADGWEVDAVAHAGEVLGKATR
jgi:F420-dependent oxidoreductase-like protein